ncbi:MAG: hypothetical protein WDW36_000104 [Sanguina aurantia]
MRRVSRRKRRLRCTPPRNRRVAARGRSCRTPPLHTPASAAAANPPHPPDRAPVSPPFRVSHTRQHPTGRVSHRQVRAPRPPAPRGGSPPLTTPRPLLACTLPNQQTFRGIQTLSPTSPRTGSQTRLSALSDEWTVEVRLQHVDLGSSYVCGEMHATSAVPGFYNPPRTAGGWNAGSGSGGAAAAAAAQKPIVTFFEGEIVDNKQVTFLTGKWAACPATDASHWRRMEGWDGVKGAACRGRGLAEGLADSPCIYMRWKEQFFVSLPPGCCLLTIEGFYYIALNRQTGALHGLYYDPDSVPFQELRLHPASSHKEPGGASPAAAAACCRSGGQSFGSYQLA